MTMREVNEIEEKVLNKLDELDPETQEFVLDYLNALASGKANLPSARLRGIASHKFLEATAALHFDPQDTEEMEEAIEEMDREFRTGLPPGEPGWQFVEALQKLDFTPEDLAEMAAAMEELEKVNLEDWDLSS